MTLPSCPASVFRHANVLADQTCMHAAQQVSRPCMRYPACALRPRCSCTHLHQAIKRRADQVCTSAALVFNTGHQRAVPGNGVQVLLSAQVPDLQWWAEQNKGVSSTNCAHRRCHVCTCMLVELACNCMAQSLPCRCDHRCQSPRDSRWEQSPAPESASRGPPALAHCVLCGSPRCGLHQARQDVRHGENLNRF